MPTPKKPAAKAKLQNSSVADGASKRPAKADARPGSKPAAGKSPQQGNEAAKSAKANVVAKPASKTVTAKPLKPSGSAKSPSVSSLKPAVVKQPVTKAKAATLVKPGQSGSTKSGATLSGAGKKKSTAVATKVPPKAAKTAGTSQSKSAFKPRSKKVPSEKFVRVSAQERDTIMKRLCELYPDADCELTFETPFQLLISVILSAQTTDVTVNKVTPGLFKRFPDAKALAEADLEEVKQLIKQTGFFNAKATNIQLCAQALVTRFGGVVPNNLEELVTLPGAGRKTANVVLGVAFNEPGWTVDTHVQRLVRRLGFTEETDPVKIEFALQKEFPNQDWSKYSITLIWHGRRMCFARKPNCPACPVNHICPSSEV